MIARVVLMICYFFLYISTPSYSDAVSAKEELIIRDTARNIKCLLCHGESVYDSNSSFAVAMRKFIKEMLEQGYNQDDILLEIKKSYGAEVIMEPDFSGCNIILWISPTILLLVSGYFIFRKMI